MPASDSREAPGSAATSSGAQRVVPPHRRHAAKVDPRVLEAHTAQRYGTFRLPCGVTDLLQSPHDETDWAKAEQLAGIVLDLADGRQVLHLPDDDMAILRDAMQSDSTAGGGAILTTIEVGSTALPAGTRVLFSQQGQGGVWVPFPFGG